MNVYGSRLLRNIIWRYVLRNPRFRLWLTRLLVKDEDRIIELFGSPICANSIKEIGYINACRSNQSNIVARDEMASVINLALLLEPRDAFVDIGANVGLYSSILGRMSFFCPTVIFYAFEANPDTYGRLCRSTSKLRIKTECVALSNRQGTLSFCEGAVSGAFGCKSTASKPHFQLSESNVEVDAKRLDQYNIDSKSVIIKIDVEGHEWEVLEGAKRLFDEMRIKAVYIDDFTDHRIPNFLSDRGFLWFDGRTLESPPRQKVHALWIHQNWIRHNN